MKYKTTTWCDRRNKRIEIEKTYTKHQMEIMNNLKNGAWTLEYKKNQNNGMPGSTENYYIVETGKVINYITEFALSKAIDLKEYVA